MSSRSPELIVQQILDKRGIAAGEQARFLAPDFERDLYPAELMKGMDVAVDRLVGAIDEHQKIAVYGDYDADGVPATAVLVRGLKRLGVEVKAYIPTRAAGYGLTPQSVQTLIADQARLLITVDNGTVAQTEIATLAEVGIDTIVCDHHQPHPGQVADRALAILNPKQADCPYPFKELCGCAIAWKLMQALYRRLEQPVQQLKWELDLVGLATIADMVPLVEENRVLAWYGLQVMHRSRNQGLRALAAVSGTDISLLSAGDISFRLAPRINAPSRMHSERLDDGENVALRLLTTDDSDEATRLAAYMQQQNAERQELLDVQVRQAREQASEQADALCIVVYDPGWSSGVIGLIAGRLLEYFGRPVVVLAREGESVKGSVRSVEGIDAVDLLTAGEAYLERFGGHAKAGGLTLQARVDVILFQAALQGWMQTQGLGLVELAAAARRAPDLDLDLSEATLELGLGLQNLEPFGVGFPSPIFESQARLQRVRRVGKQATHLSAVLQAGQSTLKAIGFGLAGQDVSEGQLYRVEYSLEVEEWQGSRQASGHIRRLSLC